MSSSNLLHHMVYKKGKIQQLKKQRPILGILNIPHSIQSKEKARFLLYKKPEIQEFFSNMTHEN